MFFVLDLKRELQLAVDAGKEGFTHTLRYNKRIYLNIKSKKINSTSEKSITIQK